MTILKNMIMIGATNRNNGKTTLALKIIDLLKEQVAITAFKIITVKSNADRCPRGGAGCGMCSGLKGCFEITEESREGQKDTMLLKAAGASHVFLIRSLKENLKEALEAALKLVPEDNLILCESNSARLVAEPALFVMIKNAKGDSVNVIKPTAETVIQYADAVLQQNDSSFEKFIQLLADKSRESIG